METYFESGLEGIAGMEPTCPNCKHVNAMLIDYKEARERGLSWWSADVFKCRDCGHIHIFNKELDR